VTGVAEVGTVLANLALAVLGLGLCFLLLFGFRAEFDDDGEGTSTVEVELNYLVGGRTWSLSWNREGARSYRALLRLWAATAMTALVLTFAGVACADPGVYWTAFGAQAVSAALFTVVVHRGTRPTDHRPREEATWTSSSGS
jgi:hypothetical protein